MTNTIFTYLRIHFRHPIVFAQAWMQHDEGNLKNGYSFLKKDSAPLGRLCNTPVSSHSLTQASPIQQVCTSIWHGHRAIPLGHFDRSEEVKSGALRWVGGKEKCFSKQVILRFHEGKRVTVRLWYKRSLSENVTQNRTAKSQMLLTA